MTPPADSGHGGESAAFVADAALSPTGRTYRPLVLAILDGWGHAQPGSGNAVELADTPTFDRLWATCPHGVLDASGGAVGLPAGQMGNSEVGHLNIGAGRVVYQDLTRIDKAIADGGFFANPVLRQAFATVRERRGTFHLLGLVSDGGVHSAMGHLQACFEMARREGVDDVVVHAFLDGRDTPPHSSPGFLAEIEQSMTAMGVGGSARSAAVTTPWTAIPAGSASAWPTTRSPTVTASRRPAPRPPCRRPTSAARPTSSCGPP